MMDPLKPNPESRRGPVLAQPRQEPAPTVPGPTPARDAWLASPAGQYVMRWETEQLAGW